MTNTLSPESLINYSQYPIDQTDSKKRQTIVDQVRAELADDGCAVIRNFFSDEGLQASRTKSANKPSD